MAAKCFIVGTFFAPMCRLCVKLYFISLSIFLNYFVCFTLILLLFAIIFITFGCGFDIAY